MEQINDQNPFDPKTLGTIVSERCYVIAEIGQNHQGKVEIAKELLRQAKLCGVDAVKSQKRDLSVLLSAEEREKPYLSIHAFGRTYGEHRSALELSKAQWMEVLDYAREIGISYFGSPWDIPSARLLRDIGCSIFKIPSAALTNLALIQEISTYGKPVIVSTGMSGLPEIDAAIALLSNAESYLMQCTSAYPTNFESVNLRAMATLATRYRRPIGLSGHHRGIAIDTAAVALGARLLERHFTLDRTWKGSDHAASLEPPGLARLVRDTRAVEAALGASEKKLLPCEAASLAKLRGPLQRTQARDTVAA